MTYATLMVNLDPGLGNAAVLQVAGDLSERIHARVIGIAAGQMVNSIYADGYVPGSLINEERAEAERLVKLAETEFRNALHNRAEAIEWRSAVGFTTPAAFVAAEARSADLLVTGGGASSTRSVNTGDLIMQAGRPVLVVPTETTVLHTQRIVIAWKDTREARRAAFDALPLLKLTEEVLVVEIAREDEAEGADRRTRDVAGWLGRHGIAAEAIVSAPGSTDHHRLHEIARERQRG